MSGGFPTWPSRTGEVWLFRSFRLRCCGAGTWGLGGRDPEPLEELEGEAQGGLLTRQPHAL